MNPTTTTTMNGNNQEPPPPQPDQYPTVVSSSSLQPPLIIADQQPSSSSINGNGPHEVDFSHKLAEAGPPSSSAIPHYKHADEKMGTHVMGTPAVPTCHPNNQKAALWGAAAADQYDYQNHHYPYLQYYPIDNPSTTAPIRDSVLHKFNSWSRKAETTANNIWHHLKTGSSVPGAAWAKVNLTAKAITGGGFEALYKQTFATFPNESLKKTFASYLSTTTGPVAGTLYLSNFHVAFCSDRPLSFTAPSGQQTWSYYKIMIPLGKIAAINPVIMRENPSERYLQVVTVDGHDFWFMGFVNYEKASQHLFESMSNIAAPGVPVDPPAAVVAHNKSH